MKSISLTIIVSPIQENNFMHVADVFEKFKVLIQHPPTRISHEIQDGDNISDYIKRFVEVSKKDKTSKFRVIACFHPYLADGAWIDQNIITISNGEKWAMFKEYLAHYHYVGTLQPKSVEEIVAGK